jgi:hypothetical protein
MPILSIGQLVNGCRSAQPQSSVILRTSSNPEFILHAPWRMLIVTSFFYTHWIFTAKDKTCLEPNYTLDIYLSKMLPRNVNVA